jgi:hypothetical protein
MTHHNSSGKPSIRQTLFKEFRALMTFHADSPVPETDAVIVLSADSLEYLLPEDKARIRLGVQIIHQAITNISGKHSVTYDDVVKNAPELILDGASEQLPLMTAFVAEISFPRLKTRLVDCGKKEHANTKTQLEALSNLNLNHIILVTSWYHVPRVRRTARKHLPSSTSWVVFPVPIERLDYDPFVVRSEIRKIEAYASKGDIACDG